MELASIYLDETKLDKNNKFTINFLTTESDFNVFFNKNTICYITNLDLNIILDDKTTSEHNEKVKKLSKLSNDLISNSFINRKFDTVNLMNFRSTNFNLPLKLDLNNDMVDILSYKYEFLDTTDNKIKKCKIYDQYQHLKTGMEFVYKNTLTYHIHLNDNKLIKQVEHNNEKWKLDFARYVNSIIFTPADGVLERVLLKTPLYNELFNLYRDINIRISKKQLFFQYYFNVSLMDDKVICNENKFNSLSELEKKNVVFVALKNKKIRILKNRTFWLPPANVRGNHKFSFVDNLTFRGSHILNKNFLSNIRKLDPNYPFEALDKFITNQFSNIDLDILDNDVNVFPTINWNPWFFISSPTIDEQLFFASRVGITDKEQINDLTNTDKTKLKKFVSKEVDQIKELLESEEVKESLKKGNNLKQREFYLYDNSNIIKPTLLINLNKKVNLYGKMELQSSNFNKLNKLIKTEDSLKFQVSRSIFKKELDFEIQNIIKEESIKTTDSKIYNITIVMVPQITKRYMLVDSIKIIAFSAATEKLNPVSIIIENNDLINHFSKSKNYKFRLTVNAVLLSSNIKNEDQVIHLNTTSLTDARYSLINHKLLKSLGQINLNEIENFDVIKQKKAWLNCILSDSKKVPYGSKHFSYSFITNKLVNILNFEIEFLNRKGERLEWNTDEKRLPNITFTIDVLK